MILAILGTRKYSETLLKYNNQNHNNNDNETYFM